MYTIPVRYNRRPRASYCTLVQPMVRGHDYRSTIHLTHYTTQLYSTLPTTISM